MPQLSQPPPGNRIRVKQTDQQVRFTFSDDITFNVVMSLFLGSRSVLVIQQGMSAMETESIWTGAVLLPWAFGLALLAGAGLFLVSRPAYYSDPPGGGGKVCLQWTVAEIVIDRQGLQLRLRAPRPRWVNLPLSHVLRIELVDEHYVVLLKRGHERFGIIRTRHQNYMIGAGLKPAEQDWLVTELSTLLHQFQRGDR